jgi:hypothetical protein
MVSGCAPGMSTVVLIIRISAKGVACTVGKMDRADLILRETNTGISKKRKVKDDGDWNVFEAFG